MATPVRSARRDTSAALTPGQRPEFATACAEARDGFRDVVNLVLVADEVTGRSDPDARVATLNRLVAFRAVATWERFLRDVGTLCGVSPPMGRFACLRPEGGGPGVGLAWRILSEAAGGALPEGWRIRFPAPAADARLTFVPIEGAPDELAAAVDWWVRARHGAPARRLPRDVAWPARTHAHDTDGRVVDATTARFAMTLFLQLLDSSIRVLAQEAGMARAADLWLPPAWLHGEDEDGTRLWTGEAVTAG